MISGALIVAAVAGLSLFGLRHLGTWLELDEPLAHARAVVVLGGGQPFREEEAATLYRAGWAKEVWVTHGLPDDRDTALARIGLPAMPELERSRQVLTKLGVPSAAIQVIPNPVNNTVTELRTIIRYAESGPNAPIIIVTSTSHTRRVRVIWNAVADGRQRAIVRYTPDDAYDGARWWRTTTDLITTTRETVGILNVWAGFPIVPRDR
jgi:uncharacterized SAM-binding protein YcdF (DUF218 family)